MERSEQWGPLSLYFPVDDKYYPIRKVQRPRYTLCILIKGLQSEMHVLRGLVSIQ